MCRVKSGVAVGLRNNLLMGGRNVPSCRLGKNAGGFAVGGGVH